MTAVIVIAAIVGAVVVFSAVSEVIRRMRKAARLNLGDPPPLSDERDDEVLRVIRKEDQR